MLNLKNLIKNNKLINLLSGLSSGTKAGLGMGAFFIGGNTLSWLYSKVYNVSQFDSMHSGKESSMSSYVNKTMTDFGSGWKGISKNITKLIGNKNKGLSSVMKESISAFNNNGVDLGKTMMKITKKTNKHQIRAMRTFTMNPTLELHKNRNIGHIVL